MRMFLLRWFLIFVLIVLVSGNLFGDVSVVQASSLLEKPILDLGTPLEAKGNPEHMVNLIVCAAVIVGVIFVGIFLRRPKS